jgi:hypothetical protein
MRRKRKGGCCAIDAEIILKFFIIDHRGGSYTFWHESLDALCIVSSFMYGHYAANRFAHQNLSTTMLVIESIFLVDCLLSFIKNYEDPFNPKGPPISNISKIFMNYVNGSFKYDAIGLMPFNLLKLTRDRQNLLYIFKLIRLKRGFENLEVMDYLKMYKKKVAKGIEYKIKKQKA